MPSQPRKYRRLPGTGYGVARRSTLWIGEDHLLGIHSSGYSEDYKRFYFRDIQAVVLRKTETGRIISGILGAFSVICLMAVLTTSIGFNFFWYIVTGCFMTFLVINTFFGPTCVCQLRTAVQTEELPSLRRLRRARKVLARLRPLIAAAQGEVVPAEIPARMAELAKPPAESAPTDVPLTTEPFTPPSVTEPSTTPPS
jgi:hypothetical protein